MTIAPSRRMPTTLPTGQDAGNFVVKYGAWILVTVGGLVVALKRYGKGFAINALSNRRMITSILGDVDRLRTRDEKREREIIELRSENSQLREEVGEERGHSKQQDVEIKSLREKCHSLDKVSSTAVRYAMETRQQNLMLRELLRSTWKTSGMDAADIDRQMPMDIAEPNEIKPFLAAVVPFNQLP